MKKNRLATNITIFMSIAIFALEGCSSFANKKSPSESTGQPVINLTYCNVNVQSKLCVASFGVENENKTLVNFIAEDPAFPDVSLKIQRNGIQNVYECQRVEDFPNSIYCTGEKLSLGETIDVEVFSKDEETLIAKGSFDISFLAISTPILSFSTQTSSTSPAFSETPSETSPTPQTTPSVAATATPQITPSITETPVDSYTNPTYP